MDEKSQIEVRVTGERFSLEAIRPRKVTKLLDTLEALVIAVVEHDYPELDLTRDGALGFTSILSGSLVAELHSPHEEVGCAWRKVNHAIEAGDYPAIPPRVTEQLREIIGFNRRHNTEAEFWENNGTRKLLAVIKSDTALPKPHSLRGTTTLYGQLLRIGGENPPTARIRFMDGVTMTCQVQTTELASKMAQRLYEMIGVRGTARWATSDMSLYEFRIEHLTEYRQTSILEAMESLREVAGKYYEEIEDINAFVAELRGRGPEDE